MNPENRRHVVLVAFLAWVGLGADGLSSVCYGPEQAFLALGTHTHLGLYLALATALTVFIISTAYNQVIELFPSGGGGYEVATQFVGYRAGLISGVALLVDYVLTITISIAAGMDALFSLFPTSLLTLELPVEIAILLLLMALNLSGRKESFQILLPVLLGFFISHLLLIGYGLYAHADFLPTLIPATLTETSLTSRELGWIFVASLFLRAYSLGGGTYTGLEAVSNNVNMLPEPRVSIGRLTMFYMAVSLSLTAAGIILLYLLWTVQPVYGQTLNAVTFHAIFDSLEPAKPALHQFGLPLLLALEAALLLIAANTGFLGGPTVLSHMAADYWVPRQFRQLSSRLTKQNGIIVMGIGALALLILTQGSVALLVVLYSINVFLTFSLSLLGLCIYWWRIHDEESHWRRRFALSLLGFTIAAAILLITLVEKFTEGGWITVSITGIVIAVCWLIRNHYDRVNAQLFQADKLFEAKLTWDESMSPPPLDPTQPTAIFIVGKSRGVGMHSLLWVQKFFSNHFKNFIFLAVGEVDAKSYDGPGALSSLRYKIEDSLCYYASYCHSQGFAADYRMAFGTDPVDEFTTLAQQATHDFPDSMCFVGELVFKEDNFFTRWLHNQTPVAVLRRLHLMKQQVLILPMLIE